MKRLRYLAPLALLLTASSAGLFGQDGFVGVDALDVMGEPASPPLSGPELEEHTEALTSVMRCPVCQGLSIADSGTAIAMAMKAEVRQFLASGYTDDQILAYFESSYGEFIRLEPKATGFNLLVWIAPFAALLVGFFLIVHRMRSAPTSTAEPKKVDEDDLDAYRERVRREVSS